MFFTRSLCGVLNQVAMPDEEKYLRCFLAQLFILFVYLFIWLLYLFAIYFFFFGICLFVYLEYLIDYLSIYPSNLTFCLQFLTKNNQKL